MIVPARERLDRNFAACSGPTLTMSDEAELDYDDPSFLLDLAPSSTSTATLSYAERRQQKLKATQQKILLNTQPRTGRLAEIQRREEGLAKNLITQRDEGDTEGEGESKALKMMRSVPSFCLLARLH